MVMCVAARATGKRRIADSCAVSAAFVPAECERLLSHSIRKPRVSTPTPLKTHSHQFILRFYHRPLRVPARITAQILPLAAGRCFPELP